EVDPALDAQTTRAIVSDGEFRRTIGGLPLKLGAHRGDDLGLHVHPAQTVVGAAGSGKCLQARNPRRGEPLRLTANAGGLCRMTMDQRWTTASVDDSRYALLVNAITDYAIYMLDPSGRVTSWNPGARRFKGYEADEILGRHFSRFYTEEDRAAGVPARALATAEAEGRFEHEGWRVRQDGSRFWAHVVIDPIRDPDGTLVGFAKITRDLTDRRAAEAALRRREEQFRVLVEGVTDYAIYMLDPEGRVASWNTGAQRIKGYRPAEILGEHFSRFYTDEDRAAGLPERALATAAAEG